MNFTRSDTCSHDSYTYMYELNVKLTYVCVCPILLKHVHLWHVETVAHVMLQTV